MYSPNQVEFQAAKVLLDLPVSVVVKSLRLGTYTFKKYQLTAWRPEVQESWVGVLVSAEASLLDLQRRPHRGFSLCVCPESPLFMRSPVGLERGLV